jgi:hypothetical protein
MKIIITCVDRNFFNRCFFYSIKIQNEQICNYFYAEGVVDKSKDV